MRYLLISGLVVFVLGGLGQTLISCPDCFQNFSSTWPIFLFSGLLWALLWKGSEILVLILNNHITWFEAPLKRFLSALIIVVFYTVVVYFSLLLLVKYLLSGQDSFYSLIETNMEDLGGVLLITLGINTFMHGRAFLYAWRQEAIHAEQIKTEQISAQYKSLRNQVNPHFLFNSLNALSSLVYDDQEKAVEFIGKLSQVYRYILDQQDNEVVSLNEELMFAQSFIYLQQIRFGNHLNFTIKDSAELNDYFVLPVSIQMLIENAIKHNIIDQDHPMYIRVELEQSRDYLLVTNSLQRKKIVDSTGIGLENLKSRYDHFSNKKLEIHESENVFTVKLPLLNFK